MFSKFFRPPSQSPLGSLIAANSWASPFAGPLQSALDESSKSMGIARLALKAVFSSPEFVNTRAAASLERITLGKIVVNAWSHATRDAGNTRVGLFGDVTREIVTTDISNKSFKQILDMTGVIFPGPVQAQGAVFNDEVWLSGCEFLGEADFRQSQFKQLLNVERAHFSGTGNFAGTHFERGLEGREAVFGGDVRFAQARFSKDVWLRGSRFGGETNFEDTAFEAEAGLGGSRFSGPVSFRHAVFGGGAGFDSCTFDSETNFSEARFERNAWFQKAAFNGPADFSLARFSGKMSFTGISVAESVPQTLEQIEQLKRAFGG